MTHRVRIINWQQLYYRSGLFTFLLFFIPVIPGFVESHVKAYLTVANRRKHDVRSMEEAIRLMFGERGVSAFKEFVQQNPMIIMPDEIFKVWYQQGDIETGLKLISRVFFDRNQRADLYSDRIRATIYEEIPHMIEAIPLECQRKLRVQLVQKMASATLVDQGIISRLAAIESSTMILQLIVRKHQRRKELRLNAELEMLSTKIKAEMAGSASIYTAPIFSKAQLRQMPEYLLTTEAIEAITYTLSQLALSAAPEIKAAAIEAMKKVNQPDLRYIGDMPQFYPVRKQHLTSN